MRYLSLKHGAGTAYKNCCCGYPGCPDSCIDTFCDKIRCILWGIYFERALSRDVHEIQNSRFNLLSSLCVKAKEMLLLPPRSSVTEASAKLSWFFFVLFFSCLGVLGAQAGCVTWRHHHWDARLQNRLNPRKSNHRKCVSFVSSFSYVTLLWAWSTVRIINALIYGNAGRAGPKHSMTGNHIVSHPQHCVTAADEIMQCLPVSSHTEEICWQFIFLLGLWSVWWTTGMSFISDFTKAALFYNFPVFIMRILGPSVHWYISIWSLFLK